MTATAGAWRTQVGQRSGVLDLGWRRRRRSEQLPRTRDIDFAAGTGSCFRCLMDGPIELARREGLERVPAGKQLTLGQHDAASLALAPPQPQQFQQLRRQHGVAVLASLALLDADQHARAVDVADLEGRHL